jgi:hypothetical protein
VRRAFRLGWSRWRRAHQAVAARSRAATRGTARAAPPAPRAVSPPTAPTAGLTGAEWALVAPLLPPQQSRRGRPSHDHRTVLSGILAVVRTDSSWRAMPREYGKWERAYKRYQLWCASGLWPRILAALGLDCIEGGG